MLDVLLHEIARIGLQQEKIINALGERGIVKREDIEASVAEIVARIDELKKQIELDKSSQELVRILGKRWSRTRPFRIKKRK